MPLRPLFSAKRVLAIQKVSAWGAFWKTKVLQNLQNVSVESFEKSVPPTPQLKPLKSTRVKPKTLFQTIQKKKHQKKKKQKKQKTKTKKQKQKNKNKKTKTKKQKSQNHHRFCPTRKPLRGTPEETSDARG